MKKQKPKVPSQGYLHSYTRSRLGFSASSTTSIFELCCKALAADDLPKPDGLSYKEWVSMQAVYIANNAPKQRTRLDKEAIREIVREQRKTKRKSHVPKPTHIRGVSVVGDAFLQTYEWRRVRMQALKLHGARCQCCGASPDTGAVMNVDHIKPRRLFPQLALDLTNLQVLCGDCNHGKGNWDMTDWRPVETEMDREATAHMRAI